MSERAENQVSITSGSCEREIFSSRVYKNWILEFSFPKREFLCEFFFPKYALFYIEKMNKN